MLISIGIVGASLANPLVKVATTELPTEILTPNNSKLDKTIEWLSWCESRDNPNAVNKHDPDTASIGRFQFKWATWNYYIDKYDLFPNTEHRERWNLIYDGQAQEIVVRTILENEPQSWTQWYNCLKGKVIDGELK